MIDLEQAGRFDNLTIDWYKKRGGRLPQDVHNPTFQGELARATIRATIEAFDKGANQPILVWSREVLEGSNTVHYRYIEDPKDSSALTRLKNILDSIERLYSYPEKHAKLPGHLDWITQLK